MIVDTMLAAFIAFCRIGTFLFFLPFLSGRAIPNMVKIIFGMSIALGVSDKIDLSTIATTPQLLFVVITQMGIGLALANLVGFLLKIPQMAGMIMDFDMGFSMTAMLNINSGTQVTIIANILDMFFMIVFIAMNGLNSLIFVMVKSFDYTASIAMLLERGFLDLVMNTLLFAFASAIQIALPLTGTIFIMNIILVIMAKSAPQLNVFANSFAVRITFGLVFIAISVPTLGSIFQQLSTEIIEQYMRMFDYFLY